MKIKYFKNKPILEAENDREKFIIDLIYASSQLTSLLLIGSKTDQEKIRENENTLKSLVESASKHLSNVLESYEDSGHS